MNSTRNSVIPVLALLAAILGGCTQGNTSDDAAAGVSIPLGLERFLIFPNPQVQTGGGFETTTAAYAQAYYAAVDPSNAKDTLDKWKLANGFGTAGQEFNVVFRDVEDLGYGRRMTGRRNADGSIAFFVENYHISTVPGGYSTINVDAAVAQDGQWHVGTNAIEWSCDPLPPGCARPFAKFYNFNPVNGARQGELDLDGRGVKAMPNICVNCHGGRGDPLTTGGTFAKVANAVSGQRGDVLAKLQGFNVDSFEWSTAPGYTRADQEAVLKTFNEWVWCTYPGGASLPAVPSRPWGTCTQPSASGNEWQATAAEMIEQWYGGPGMPNPQFSDTYIPTNWQAGNVGAPAENLYTQVVAPYCRTCHILRGTRDESDIDFMSLAKFNSYDDRIKAHVFDRGNMPLAFLVYGDFWRSAAPGLLATHIDGSLALAPPGSPGTATTASGGPRQPGRPVADPGPGRMARAGVAAPLSAADSLFATSYSWAVTASPAMGDAVITNASSSSASFLANTTGVYTVQLTVANGSQTDSNTVDITVDPAFPNPSSIKFAHVKDVLRNVQHPTTANPVPVECTNCHTATGDAPIAYTDIDRDGVVGVTAADDDWFLRELRGRINLTEIKASPLLRKPSGEHHFGGDRFQLNTTLGLSSYSKVFYWIVNGTPPGGVIANAVATISNPVTFSGGTFGVPLSGLTSIGASTYSWSVLPSNIPAHANGTPPIATQANVTQPNPSLPGATLNVFDAGTYDVTLLVANGADTDQKTISVNVQEVGVTANFTPHSGASGTTANVSFTFSGIPSTDSVTLNATTTGNPTSCTWQVSPAGPTLGTPNSCTSTTFQASTSQINQTFTVTFTARNVTNQAIVTKGLTIQSASGSNPVGADFTFGSPKIRWTVSGTPGGPQSVVMSSNTLSGSVTSGLSPLTYSWSTTPSNANGTPAPSCSITSPGQNASLSTTGVGDCSVTLTVTNGLNPSSQRTRVVSVGALYTFAANVVGVFTGAGCTGCHVAPGTATQPNWNQPGLHARIISEGVIGNGRLLSCPSSGCGGMGGSQPGFEAGDTSNYDIFLTWINSGAPDN
ncbi:MAG: hypothetical protein ACKVP2_18465 [Burkholderiales bacterium]